MTGFAPQSGSRDGTGADVVHGDEIDDRVREDVHDGLVRGDVARDDTVAAIDVALDAVEEVSRLPLADHAAVYASLHATLQDALSDAERVLTR